MNDINAIAQRLRDIASLLQRSNLAHPVMLHRLMRDIPTDLHTCANNLYSAANCGIGPDGDITLALTLATAHIEHRRGDMKACLDHLEAAKGYVSLQVREQEEAK